MKIQARDDIAVAWGLTGWWPSSPTASAALFVPAVVGMTVARSSRPAHARQPLSLCGETATTRACEIVLRIGLVPLKLVAVDRVSMGLERRARRRAERGDRPVSATVAGWAAPAGTAT